MPGFGGELRDGETGAQRRGGTYNGRTPQGLTWTSVNAEGGKWGGALSRETAAEADTQRWVQGLATEASGWHVQLTSRWEALCTRRGCG